jgi:hypothetical protein
VVDQGDGPMSRGSCPRTMRTCPSPHDPSPPWRRSTPPTRGAASLPERDIGRAWRGARGATYRAAWIQATEEVYLVRHGPPAEGGGTVEVFRRRFRLRELAAAFRGYRDVVGRRGSLSWLRERTTMPPAAPA